MKFKIGDKVVRTSHSQDEVVKGNIYTIRDLNGKDIYLETLKYSYYSDYFDVVKEENYEIY